VMPGGGGLEGLSYVVHEKPDGMTIGIASQASEFMSTPLLGAPGIKMDLDKIGFIGSFGRSPGAFVVANDSPYKTVEDLRKAAAAKKRIGATAPSSAAAVYSEISLETLRIGGKIVYGYEIPEMSLATKRGEIIAYALPASAAYKDVQSGFSKIFAVVTLERGAWFPDAPIIADLVNLTPREKSLLEFAALLEDTKVFFTPPDFPKDKLEYLRRSFDKIMAMPEFVKQISPRFPVWEKPLTGEQHEIMTKKALKVSPEILKMVKELYPKYK
jgi:tripartite-type tricarboxylate transporter receptor subunit TctC